MSINVHIQICLQSAVSNTYAKRKPGRAGGNSGSSWGQAGIPEATLGAWWAWRVEGRMALEWQRTAEVCTSDIGNIYKVMETYMYHA